PRPSSRPLRSRGARVRAGARGPRVAQDLARRVSPRRTSLELLVAHAVLDGDRGIARDCGLAEGAVGWRTVARVPEPRVALEAREHVPPLEVDARVSLDRAALSLAA